MNTVPLKELISFLHDYTAFFEHVVEEEKDKLDSLLSYDLKRIEHSIAEQQAVEMKLATMEKKREQLQKEAGVEGKTFREIQALALEEDKKVLGELLGRMQEAITNIKYYNGKSLEFAKANLNTIQSLAGPNTDKEKELQGYASIAKSKGKQAGWTSQKTIFETKI